MLGSVPSTSIPTLLSSPLMNQTTAGSSSAITPAASKYPGAPTQIMRSAGPMRIAIMPSLANNALALEREQSLRQQYVLERALAEQTRAGLEVRSNLHKDAALRIDGVDELRAEQDLGPDDEYFLARLSFPYLRPQDEADFVRRDQGGRRQSDIVVTLEDADGQLLRLRHALNPKEVGRLHRLFLAAELPVCSGQEVVEFDHGLLAYPLMPVSDIRYTVSRQNRTDPPSRAGLCRG